MTDGYARFANSGPGRAVVKRLGLPAPPRLRRYRPGDPLVPGPVLLDTAPGGRLHEPVRDILMSAGVTEEGERYSALVFDASGITDTSGLRALYDFFHPNARSLTPSGRVIVLGTPSEVCESPRE